MGDDSIGGRLSEFIGNLGGFLRKFIFSVLSVGPIPNHIAFILDGNRRYAKKHNLKEGDGHRAGFVALLSMLKYCYELGVKYVTIYAFSIDNFNRRPDEVQYIMGLMHEKIEGMLKEESFVRSYGVRVHFLGDLKLLHQSVRIAAEKAMRVTANNTKFVLLICVAYTSTNETVHSVHQCFKEKRRPMDKFQEEEQQQQQQGLIKLVDLERNMYMALAPDPDILVRTSGETRLSNFLLWQTAFCYLYSPAKLWPEISLWNLVWSVLNFQRAYPYLLKTKMKRY
ncbi:PREDICTED: dehydrodolichyl diphosphate synthase 6-like [Nelumbo nucifera]|uniref:Alkyl transferase n=2 Tax=Nelumbo nucifera TaxID=4432 RepID=A0A1U8Q6C3_NELNU|nr:PREDICTED: dehydrodolichyl diphosphate synthase 6-like [Nelumbo nucifera]DAD41820.1 TPA_asm: hypothetical protein HUJ06_016143 [Nelumbo nucifera]